ncbi:DUF4174 domain-containing protein [Pseudooceanicola sp. MF1-13]|uniref:DUF4174 domain-containing protein n=1 Tax=Pseudooceanicola sp. MF1-13 TaxID=3379095 RepID=UPI0038916C35
MTRRTLPALAALILAGTTALLGSGPTNATTPATGADFQNLAPDTSDLSEYRWSHRPVMIFAPSENDDQYEQAMAALQLAQAGLADRDIIVLTDTDPSANGALRQDLNAQGFTMLLVGKDGGVKLRSDDIILPEDLFATIDQMPMRQQEMQSN